MKNIPIGLMVAFIIISMIANLIVMAIIANKNIEIIEDYLPNCSFASTFREAWSSSGLLGKIVRGGVGIVCGSTLSSGGEILGEHIYGRTTQ